jgi:UPF0176 protein
MALYNTTDSRILKKRLMEETEQRTTISFYRYFPIPDPAIFRDFLYENLDKLKVFGRIYVAKEGINAQISVPESLFNELKIVLNSISGLQEIRLNIAVDDDGKSFWVLRIKVRKKIVADGINDPDFDLSKRGEYLDAAAFNEMTDDPETIVVDMRNHYEYEVGHFDCAIEVPSDTFRDQLPMAVDMLKDKKDKNIIMYCTGGIRCEKASAWFKHQGFDKVYHLEGGIIHYVNKAREQGLPLKFKGKNFVFDERLGERITGDIISTCHQCGKPCDDHTNCANDGCHLLFIQCKKCAEEYNGCCSEECKSILELPEEKRAELRKGIDRGQMIFNKSRQRIRPRLNQNK